VRQVGVEVLQIVFFGTTEAALHFALDENMRSLREST
jgi:hypothetical protein